MARKTKHEVEVDIKVDSTAARRKLGKLGDTVEGTSKRLKEATGSISGFTNALGSSSSAVMGSTVLLGAGAVAVVAYGAAMIGASKVGSDFAIGIAQANKELENQASLSGVTASEMQKWGIAGKTVGFEQEKLADILKDVNDKMGDFTATGGGPMKDFFDNIAPKVGLTTESFKGLTSSEVLGKYVKGLEDANVSQSEMTFYMEAIANDSTALIPLLKDNARGFTAIGDEAERAGKIISEEFLQDTRDLSIAFGELETSYDAVLQDFANPLVQETTVFFKELEEVLGSEAFKNSAKVMGELAAAVLSFANDTVLGNIKLISRVINTGFVETSTLLNTINLQSIDIVKHEKELEALRDNKKPWNSEEREHYKEVKRALDREQKSMRDNVATLKERKVLLQKTERGVGDLFTRAPEVEKEKKKEEASSGKPKWELLKEEAEANKKLAKIEKARAAQAREARQNKRDSDRADRDADRDRLQAFAEEEEIQSRLGEAYSTVLAIKESGRQTEALAFAENNEQRMELQLEFDMLELEAEQEKLDTKLAMNGASFDQLAQSELAFQKQKSNLQIKFAADTAKREQAEARATLRVTAGALGAMSDLFSLGAKENKAFAIASKATAIGEAGVASYLAATKALAIYGPTPVGYAAAGTAVATGAFNIAKITQQEFEDGGVVGGFGGSTQGPDNTTAKVRTGEMVLNSGQQRQLFDLANGSGGTSGMTLNYSPVVSGDMAPEALSKALREDKAELVQIINDTITEAQFAGDF